MVSMIIILSSCISGTKPVGPEESDLSTPTSTGAFEPAADNNIPPVLEKTATSAATQAEGVHNENPQPLHTPTEKHVSDSASAIPTMTTKPARTSISTAEAEEESWQDQPVIPAVSDKVLQIYLHGLELGNNPQAFSKIGDCGSTPAWFLGDFDRGTRYYSLGSYIHLQAVIDYFKGSFDRTSLAARSGFNVSALFVPLWADRTYCQANEAPLECEYRLQKPVIAFIMLGANDVWHPDEFEPQMRKLIEYSIENGVIPILATKADNQEGDGSINATITRLALEYEIPLWNFWRAVHDLPDHGLQEDGVHLTWGGNFFDRPESKLLAWPTRNLSALQVLEAVWKKITNQQS